MKKVLVFATAALLISGAAFAGKGKSCGTKECCKDKKENVAKDKKSKTPKTTETTETKPTA